MVSNQTAPALFLVQPLGQWAATKHQLPPGEKPPILLGQISTILFAMCFCIQLTQPIFMSS